MSDTHTRVTAWGARVVTVRDDHGNTVEVSWGGGVSLDLIREAYYAARRIRCREITSD